jgi:hypothetical protein
VIADFLYWRRVGTIAILTPVAEGVVYTAVVDGVSHSYTATAVDTVQTVLDVFAASIGARAARIDNVVEVQAEYSEAALTLTGTALTCVVRDVGIAGAVRLAVRVSDSRLDDMLRIWLAAAVAAADRYIGEDYTQASEIPSFVRLGVFHYVRALKEGHEQIDGISAAGEQGRSTSFAESEILARAQRAGEAVWYHAVSDVSRVRAPR